MPAAVVKAEPDRDEMDYGVLAKKSGLTDWHAELLVLLVEIRDALKGGR